MIDIAMPKRQQETSMGRRLFAMAAPIVGGALGGPAGAAAGGLIGNKIAGQSSGDALMGGLEAGANAMSRRKDAISQSPEVGIKDGLDALSQVSPEIQKAYAPILIQADMMAARKPGMKTGVV